MTVRHLIPFLSLVLLFSNFSGAKTEAGALYYELRSGVTLRVSHESKKQSLDVHALGDLPEGTVIKVSSQELAKPSRYDFYTGGKRNGKARFSSGVEIVSAPGLTEEQVKEANKSKLFASSNLIKKSKKLNQAPPPIFKSESVAAKGTPTSEAALEAIHMKCRGDCERFNSPVKENSQKLLDASRAAAKFSPLCDFSSDRGSVSRNTIKSANCQRVLEFLKESPERQKAFLYSLELFRNLKDGKFDMSCAKRAQANTPKLKNECQFLAVDPNKPHYETSKTYQSEGLFIDLCAGTGASPDGKQIQIIRINRAQKSRATKPSAYSDVKNAYMTSVGAYLTGNDLNQFFPYGKTRSTYRRVLGWKPGDNRCRGDKIWQPNQCPAIRLHMYGLHSSNNTTAESKPMHTSAFPSSGGCDSVEKKDEWLIRKLAKNGPSLVVNYGPESMLPPKNTKECQNDKSN